MLLERRRHDGLEAVVAGVSIAIVAVNELFEECCAAVRKEECGAAWIGTVPAFRCRDGILLHFPAILILDGWCYGRPEILDDEFSAKIAASRWIISLSFYGILEKRSRAILAREVIYGTRQL